MREGRRRWFTRHRVKRPGTRPLFGVVDKSWAQSCFSFKVLSVSHRERGKRDGKARISRGRERLRAAERKMVLLSVNQCVLVENCQSHRRDGRILCRRSSEWRFLSDRCSGAGVLSRGSRERAVSGGCCSVEVLSGGSSSV